MNETITYSQMRLGMEAFDVHGLPIPFSIGFNTCDLAKNTGGDYCEYPSCIKYSNLKFKKSAGAKPNFNTHVDSIISPRNPNHWKNQTTNIAIMARNELTDEMVFTGNIFKIHYRLITKFNGKEIIWD